MFFIHKANKMFVKMNLFYLNNMLKNNFQIITYLKDEMCETNDVRTYDMLLSSKYTCKLFFPLTSIY